MITQNHWHQATQSATIPADFSLSYCQTLVKQILGDDYDESTSELNVSLHPDGLVKDTSATESSSSAK